ncbi:hypothetical protein WMY93_013824 [Mugilogobius chulae]|uniref:Uncharacterized protein n=1 Tax=Mugilogobius chulae TaxID=88201 RepID=A0AAW0P2M4_9GOBI
MLERERETRERQGGSEVVLCKGGAQLLRNAKHHIPRKKMEMQADYVRGKRGRDYLLHNVTLDIPERLQLVIQTSLFLITSPLLQCPASEDKKGTTPVLYFYHRHNPTN